MQLGALEYLISLNSNSLDKDIKKADNKLTAWAVAKGQMISNVLHKAFSAATSGMKELVRGAYNAFADYEQLVGGIETIFKKELDPKAFDAVMRNAQRAFRTTGQSANEYMDTVMSFSASLLQGLGGDTKRAAEVSDMAMQDMADNANKMGSTMESVESAYRGFAKQNYTMLDNLKLGYGGTKTEMQRLLKDAQKITGKKYNLNNLADVYEAIHVIQEEMGITGTTAEEAAKTVAGSTNMMKASWKNLLIAIGSGENVKQATKDFMESMKTVLTNAKPVIRNIISGIGESISEALNKINIPILKKLIPNLKKLGKIGIAVVKSFVKAWRQDGLKGILNETRRQFGFVRASIAESLKIDNPDEASWKDIGLKIYQNIKTKLFGKDASWSDIGKQILERIKGGFKNAVIKALDILGIETPTDATWGTIAGSIIAGIQQGITTIKLKALDLLGIEDPENATWQTIWGKIKNGLKAGVENFKLKIADALGIDDPGGASWIDIWGKIRNGLKAGVTRFRLKVADLLNLKDDTSWSAIWGKIKSGLQRGKDNFKLKLTEVLGMEGDASWGDIGKKIAQGIKDAIGHGKTAILKLILGDDLPEGEYTIKNAGEKIAGWLVEGMGEGGFIDTWIKGLSEKWSTIASAAGTLLRGFADWVKNNSGEVAEFVKDIVGVVIEVLPHAITALVGLADKLVEPLTELIIGVFNTMVALVGDPEFVKKIANLIKTLITSSVTIISTLITTIAENLPEIIQTMTTLFGGILQGVIAALPEIVTEALKAVGTLLGVGDIIPSWETIRDWWNTNIAPYLNLTAILHLIPRTVLTGQEGDESWGEAVDRVNAQYNMPTSDSEYSQMTQDMWNDPNTAKGMWNVPYDGFRTRLHRDEMVLTKSQARQYRDHLGENMDYSTMGSMIGASIQKAMGKVYVMMSGEKVGDLTTRRVKRNINANSYNKLRALGG